MVFQMLALRICPNAEEPCSPENEFSNPASPVVEDSEPGEKVSNPDRMALYAGPPAAGEDGLCRLLGMADISWDKVFWPVPAEVAAAWATAPAWAGMAEGLAICWGWVNVVSWVAVAEEAASAYIAAAAWAHMSPYWASVAAIAGVFWPKVLVATSCISWARLTAIVGGGTVA